MKKFIILCILFLCILELTGCASKHTEQIIETQTSTAEQRFAGTKQVWDFTLYTKQYSKVEIYLDKYIKGNLDLSSSVIGPYTILDAKSFITYSLLDNPIDKTQKTLSLSVGSTDDFVNGMFSFALGEAPMNAQFGSFMNNNLDTTFYLSYFIFHNKNNDSTINAEFLKDPIHNLECLKDIDIAYLMRLEFTK